MPSETTRRYRESAKGKASSRKYANRYYHRVLKHNPIAKKKRLIANRENHYRRNYGLTPEQADTMKLSGCQVCMKQTGKMNIDHCHATGRVRGVLCNACNIAIGYLERSVIFRAAIDAYLKEN